MATNWRRAAVASPAAWLPWVLIGVSVAAGLLGAWSTWGTEAAVAFLIAWWSRLLIVAAAVVVLSVFVWWLWWRQPTRQVDRFRFPISDPKGRADVEDNFRKTAGQLLGGIVVLIGAVAAYLQFTQQQKAGHDLLISNQVAKGFELLGNKEKDLSQRLGGIYALEGVMNDSEQYHQPVLESLCAFVRDYTKNKKGDDPPATDIQAALTVIGRRSKGAGQVDLRDVRIPDADLSSGANLAGARLTDADLRGAADLSGALLRAANLTGANLTGANLSAANLSAANLQDANLTGADLAGALNSAILIAGNLNSAQGLTQEQLDQACGESVKGLDRVQPPLTFHPKPCPPAKLLGPEK